MCHYYCRLSWAPTILSIYRPGRGEPVDGTLVDGRGAASTLKVNTEGSTPARIEEHQRSAQLTRTQSTRSSQKPPTEKISDICLCPRTSSAFSEVVGTF